MAQIITDYDLSLGSTQVAVGTNANNIRFQYSVTGATPTQKVILNPVCSEDDTTYKPILKENLHPFSFHVDNDGGDSQHLIAIGSSFVELEVIAEGCTGLLNVFTYES